MTSYYSTVVGGFLPTENTILFLAPNSDGLLELDDFSESNGDGLLELDDFSESNGVGLLELDDF